MKIAIVGSHGVGKTSLMSKMENDVYFCDYTFYPEAVREVSRLGFPYNEASTDSSQLAMLALHLLHVEHDTDMVTDRFIVDGLIYSQILRSKGSEISKDCIDILRTYWDKYKDKIDLYVYCPAEWEIKNDNFRMTDTYMRDMVSTLMLAQLYMDIPKEKFLIVHGETDQRKEQVKAYVKALRGELNV